MSTIKVSIPDLSGAENVDVIEVLVKPGDVVAEGDSIIALETDKASMEVPAEQAGTIVSIAVKEGDQVNEGDLLMELEVGGAAAPAAEPAAEATPAAAEAPAPAAAPATAPAASAVEQVLVPDLSGAEDVDVIEVLVKAGDIIAEGDSLIALETDKASMEVPAPKGGVVKAVHISEGGKVNEGDLLLDLEVAGAAPAEAPAAAAPVADPAPAAAAAPVSGGVENVLVPDLSGATDVDVIEVLVKDGDTIAEGDSLIALETDKASMEVPAPKGGVVKSMKIKEGDKVNEGDLLLELEVVGAAPAAAPAAAAPASAPSAPAQSAPAPAPAAKPAASTDLVALEQKNRSVHAGPAVRAIAREFGVDLTLVSGSGRKGRIVKEDVQAYVKGALKKLAEVSSVRP